jgi:hypothetical protein
VSRVVPLDLAKVQLGAHNNAEQEVPMSSLSAWSRILLIPFHLHSP